MGHNSQGLKSGRKSMGPGLVDTFTNGPPQLNILLLFFFFPRPPSQKCVVPLTQANSSLDSNQCLYIK